MEQELDNIIVTFLHVSLVPRASPSFLSLAVQLLNLTASDGKLGENLGMRLLTCDAGSHGIPLRYALHLNAIGTRRSEPYCIYRR